MWLTSCFNFKSPGFGLTHIWIYGLSVNRFSAVWSGERCCPLLSLVSSLGNEAVVNEPMQSCKEGSQAIQGALSHDRAKKVWPGSQSQLEGLT